MITNDHAQKTKFYPAPLQKNFYEGKTSPNFFEKLNQARVNKTTYLWQSKKYLLCMMAKNMN